MSFWFESDYYCTPLKSLKEIQSFIFEPPIWRTLCKPLTPHSTITIKNSEVDPNFENITLERPLTFCHFEPSQIPDTIGDTLRAKKELPKLLVCHDMANGYHDDSNINGTDNFDAYTFYNWAAVDIFCYFSHHLVTVPPVGWINAAHAHGVKVIGTFITEWADGVTLWNEIFAEENASDNLISSLVAIAKTLKFEGWLINVENKISEPDKLVRFMDNLHKTLHQEIPGAELIWYDSVTKTGQLCWQNRLNELNRPFFDVCDGIFTNYSWNENDIIASAKEAGSRLKDVYIGIDVWGRNFFGGGMFNTQEAVKVAYRHGCSLAVFAPAWTHEAMEDENSSDYDVVFMGESLSKYERFMIRDRALWDSLWPFLNTKLPCTLPFQTSFCRGLGSKRRRYGEVFTNSPWYNLRHMQYQPNCAHGPHGYLLSTDDNIQSLSHLVIKNTKGILKLRQSLMQLTIADRENDEDQMVSDQPKTNENENKVNDEDKPTSSESKTTCGTSKAISSESKTMENEAKTSKNVKIIEENEVSDESKKIRDKDKKAEDKTKAEGKKDTTGKLITDKSCTSDLDESNLDKLKGVLKKIFRQKRKHRETETNNEITKPKKSELNQSDSKEVALPSGGAKSAETVNEITKLEQPERNQRDLKGVHSSTHTISSGRSMMQGVSVKLGHNKKRYTVAYIDNEKECLQLWLNDSFNGGSCLRINPSDPVSEDHRTIRLFRCNFHIKAGDTLVVCVATKLLPGSRSQWLDLLLYVMMTDSNVELVKLEGLPQSMSRKVSISFDKVCHPLEVTSNEFAKLREYLVVHEPGFYLVPENAFGWNIMYFQVSWQIESRVRSINLRTGNAEGSILLGHVGLCTRHSRR